ncbi:MAG: hypothetical protein Q7U57_10010 [Methylovulum sp.]|nr:hypothetical protein [Methylovulum sp.]
MDERTKAAFASVSETSKQLITLATGILGLEITFAKDIIGCNSNITETAKCFLHGSWFLLLSSIVAGVWMLLAVTGSLSKVDTLTPKTIYEPNIRIPAVVQVLLFIGGLLLSVWFGTQIYGKT